MVGSTSEEAFSRAFKTRVRPGAGVLACRPRRASVTDTGRTLRHLPTILLVLSFPAAVIAYSLTVQVMTATLSGRSNDVLVLLVSLFVAGLVMLPFLIPFFDRKAKRDLAAYRSEHPDVGHDTTTSGRRRDGPAVTAAVRRSRRSTRGTSWSKVVVAVVAG